MQIFDLLPAVGKRVKRRHLDVGLHGHHDWVHAARVALWAYRVAVQEWPSVHTAFLAAAAGMTHNADRILQYERKVETVPKADIETLVLSWLEGSMSAEHMMIVVDAVLKHDDVNRDDDSQVTIALKDADRVVNSARDGIIRSGQNFAALPAVDYVHFISNPDATYRKPLTAARDAAYVLDWTDPTSRVCVRTKLAREIAGKRTQAIREYFDGLKIDLEEDGVYDLPLEQ